MKYKLVCFDVDGTLVEDGFGSAWQLFHNHFRIDPEKRKENKDFFLSKKISYLEWANMDINLWIDKGVRKNDFVSAIRDNKVRLMPGAKETIAALKKKGLKIAIISGSIDIILETLLPEFTELFDDIYITRIRFSSDGKIESYAASEFDMEGKARALKIIAKREGFKLSECVFIGDHHNDVEIAKEAGLSIAFDAKDDELRKISDVVIDEKDISLILAHIL